jgi:hypothetical protein
LLADGPVVLFFYPAAMTVGCTADTDRRVLDVISSELRMSVHADRALDALRVRH